jgi:hypothetical protein
MFTRSLKGCAVLFAALAFVSQATYGQDGNTGPPSAPVTEPANSATPPVEQALVPEGVFAIRLAEALKLGQTEDESRAESLLSGLGIEPKNGWITEYPVTPAVIGDIEKGLSTAADNGKLGMGKDQALKVLADVKTQLGLNISTESAPPPATSGKPVEITIYKYTDRKGIVHITNEYNSIPEEYRSRAIIVRHAVKPQSAWEEPAAPASEYAADQDQTPAADQAQTPEVINNYYYVEGPPVVTYYSPPEPYGYLYSWTPYPFWSSGVYFPGFFVLHDFHRHVWFNRKPYVTSFHFHGGGFRKKFARNPGGGAFPFRGGPASRRDRVPSPQIFYPPQIQRNARTIFNHNRHAFSGIPPVPPRQFIGAPYVHPSPFRGPMDVPLQNTGFSQGYGGRIFNPPTHNRGYGYLPPPRTFVPRPAVPGFGSRFSPGDKGFRGFHSGKGGGFGGGFRGGAGFGRHGNASGGMKSGRR